MTGSVGTVCGGGRYNNLVESVGGNPTPCVGFGMGIERLLYILDSEGIEIPNDDILDLFAVSQSPDQVDYCFRLCSVLRREGVACDTDLTGRSMKSQLKFANKIGAKYTVVIGGSEVDGGVCKLKDMSTGETCDVTISELAKTIKER